MELYAQYIKEREGRDVIVKRWGFISYLIDAANSVCDIDSIFIVAEFRRDKAGSTLADEVVEIAKARGCTILQGYNDPETEGSTISMKAMLAYGFKLSHLQGRLIVLRKEI